MKPLTGGFAALLLLASPSYADIHAATGAVATLHAHDPADANDADWLSLTGVQSLGRCKKVDAGYVILLVPDDRMFQLALTAKTSGAKLTVWTDDTVTTASGFCVVTDIE